MSFYSHDFNGIGNALKYIFGQVAQLWGIRNVAVKKDILLAMYVIYIYMYIFIYIHGTQNR